MNKPYSVDINLDDVDECLAFGEIVKGKKPEEVVEILNLPKEKSALHLVMALIAYAYNKAMAITSRKAGAIKTALYRESLCDTIYSVRIQPVCNCW